MSAKRCIGFGEHEGVCKQVALVAPFLWCNDCERLRLEAITARIRRAEGDPLVSPKVAVGAPERRPFFTVGARP